MDGGRFLIIYFARSVDPGLEGRAGTHVLQVLYVLDLYSYIRYLLLLFPLHEFSYRPYPAFIHFIQPRFTSLSRVRWPQWHCRPCVWPSDIKWSSVLLKVVYATLYQCNIAPITRLFPVQGCLYFLNIDCEFEWRITSYPIWNPILFLIIDSPGISHPSQIKRIKSTIKYWGHQSCHWKISINNF